MPIRVEAVHDIETYRDGKHLIAWPNELSRKRPTSKVYSFSQTETMDQEILLACDQPLLLVINISVYSRHKLIPV